MHHFCAAYVRDGSKAESPFLAVMSASTDCGHHVLALAWTQPAACKPDRSGSITLKQSCRLAVQTGLAIILGFLLSNESAYEPGLRGEGDHF